MSEQFLIALAVTLIAGYAMLVFRFQRFAHVLRLDMMDVGDRLLANPEVSDERKEMICYEMENTDSRLVTWAFAVLVVPVALWAFVEKISGGRNDYGAHGKVSRKTELELNRFTALSVLTSLLNSPMAMFLFALQLLLVSIAFLPIYRTSELLQKLGRTMSHSHSHHKFNHT